MIFDRMSFWGNTAKVTLPTRVRIRDDEHSPIEAICRSIARRNRPIVVANCRRDFAGNVMATHYELTLGKPMRTGGYSVSGRVWCAIHHGEARDD